MKTMAESEVELDASPFSCTGVVPDVNPFSSSEVVHDANISSSFEQEIPRQGPTESFEDVEDSFPRRERRLPFYDMSGEKVLIIFNHYIYKKTRYYKIVPKIRKGTYADVKSLEKTFRSLGFIVVTHDDWEYEDIIHYLSRVCNNDHSHTSCFAVAVMTHGERSEVAASDRAYPLSEITRLIKSAPSLKGKPKLFFIQACRPGHARPGSQPDEHFSVDEDCLLLHSCYEDYVSFRSKKHGSWMIQALCQVVDREHEVMDLAEMVTLVNGAVAAETVYEFKQMPVSELKLTKSLML